jgi:hypothetical protein
MANENENIVLMAVGVVLVLIIIAYIIYPVYFDKYILMNIPEYRHLSEVIDASNKSLNEYKTDIAKYKGELNKLAKLGGTEAEILKSGRKSVKLEKRIESYKRELKQFTGLVANLKNQLKESTMDAEECSKLQSAATKTMKETNDLLITEFVIEDKPLARRLQATRDSLLTLLTTSKDLVCANKGMALVMLAKSADMMRKNSNETNGICDSKSSSEDSHNINSIKNDIRNELFNQKTCKKWVTNKNKYGSTLTTCGEYNLTPRNVGPLKVPYRTCYKTNSALKILPSVLTSLKNLCPNSSTGCARATIGKK